MTGETWARKAAVAALLALTALHVTCADAPLTAVTGSTLSVFANPTFGFFVGARHVLGQWYGTKLAIGCRIDLDRQCSPYLVCHLASLSPQARVSYWQLADMKTVFENVCFGAQSRLW